MATIILSHAGSGSKTTHDARCYQQHRLKHLVNRKSLPSLTYCVGKCGMYCYFECVLWGALHVKSTRAFHAIKVNLNPQKFTRRHNITQQQAFVPWGQEFSRHSFPFMLGLPYRTVGIQTESCSFCHIEPTCGNLSGLVPLQHLWYLVSCTLFCKGPKLDAQRHIYEWQVPCVYILVCKKKMLNVLMPSVICVHFSQMQTSVQHKYQHTPHNTVEHAHAQMLVSTLERQVS